MIPVILAEAAKALIFNKVVQTVTKEAPKAVIQAVAHRINKGVEVNGEKPFWASKKFWLTICAALVPVINQKFGIGLDVETVATVVAALAGGAISFGLQDFGKSAKKS